MLHEHRHCSRGRIDRTARRGRAHREHAARERAPTVEAAQHAKTERETCPLRKSREDRFGAVEPERLALLVDELVELLQGAVVAAVGILAERVPRKAGRSRSCLRRAR